MKRPRVFLTHGPFALANYYGLRALTELRAIADVSFEPSEVAWTASALAQAARDCDIVISDRRVEGTAELLFELPRLVVFCRCAVDIRNIDRAAADTLGILVTQASAGFMASVSEWILGAMIDLSRGISDAVCAYRGGAQAQPVMGRELRGSVLGLIGHGQIGRYLGSVAPALGMQVLVHDPFVAGVPAPLQQVELPQLLARADHVVCLAAATPQTENLMNAAAFAAMKRGAFFINASRGNLVDEAALLAALDSGHLAGAALDVGRAPDQMPSLDLARHPRVLATPHIGGLTPPASEHQALETVQQLRELLAGRVPVGAVNAAQATRLPAFLASLGGAS